MRTEGVAEGFRPAEGVPLFGGPATTSKIPALERPAFAKVAAAAHPCRSVQLSYSRVPPTAVHRFLNPGHQGMTPSSSKNEPVGPPSGSVASRIAVAAPCPGVRGP